MLENDNGLLEDKHDKLFPIILENIKLNCLIRLLVSVKTVLSPKMDKQSIDSKFATYHTNRQISSHVWVRKNTW